MLLALCTVLPRLKVTRISAETSESVSEKRFYPRVQEKEAFQEEHPSADPNALLICGMSSDSPARNLGL